MGDIRHKQRLAGDTSQAQVCVGFARMPAVSMGSVFRRGRLISCRSRRPGLARALWKPMWAVPLQLTNVMCRRHSGRQTPVASL